MSEALGERSGIWKTAALMLASALISVAVSGTMSWFAFLRDSISRDEVNALVSVLKQQIETNATAFNAHQVTQAATMAEILTKLDLLLKARTP